MSVFNFLTHITNTYKLSYVNAFTDYDEDGYPAEEEPWEDDEDEIEDDDFDLGFDSDQDETQWE